MSVNGHNNTIKLSDYPIKHFKVKGGGQLITSDSKLFATRLTENSSLAWKMYQTTTGSAGNTQIEPQGLLDSIFSYTFFGGGTDVVHTLTKTNYSTKASILGAEIINEYTSSLTNITGSLTGSLTTFYSSSISDITGSLTGSLTTFYSSSVPDITGSLTGSLITFYSSSILDITGSLTGSMLTIHSGSINYFTKKIFPDRKYNWHDDGGKDVKKLSYHAGSNTGSLNETGRIEKQVLFFAYGNHEWISGSSDYKVTGSIYNDLKYIKNRTRDEGSVVFTTGSSVLTSSADYIGLTHYFTASTTVVGTSGILGDIVYPDNHYIYDKNIYEDLDTIYYGGPDYSTNATQSAGQLEHKFSTCYPGKHQLYFPNQLDTEVNECAYSKEVSGSNIHYHWHFGIK